MAIDFNEIKKHNDKRSCWVVVYGKIYDVTEFLPEHPGGPEIILKYAGLDATQEFEKVHPPDTFDRYLPKSKHLGDIDMTTVHNDQSVISLRTVSNGGRTPVTPRLEQCHNLGDFEAVAMRIMEEPAWAYYSSGAGDEITMRGNHYAFQRTWFRPRVLVDVKTVDLSTTMLGAKVDAPFYITAMASGKLAHPEGEIVFTKAARKHNVIQMIPTFAGCSVDEIISAREGDQVQWLQLYVNQDREVTKKLVQHAEQRGCKGLVITVDAPQRGRREKDMRRKSNLEANKNPSWKDGKDEKVGGFDRTVFGISTIVDPSLIWSDIPWFKEITKMPIILKGVQCVEDVILAIEHGVQGVVLSNHGGRRLDFARPSLDILEEVMPVLRALGWENRIEIFLDGGVRRGTDIIKALCLGARGVGFGRPFAFSMAAYGLPGVDKVMQILKDEMEADMRLLGCTSVDQLNSKFVDTQGRGMPLAGIPPYISRPGVYEYLTASDHKANL